MIMNIKKERRMQITKKVKCLHCEDVIEGTKTCSCGKITIADNVITEGVAGKDYVDVSQKLLNEVA